jgi:CspA family cold shock protein
MVKGYVKWFSNKKGYGFISLESNLNEEARSEDQGNNSDVFVHFSNIEMEGFKKLSQGDYVEFDIKEDEEKGSEAVNVKVLIKDRRY